MHEAVREFVARQTIGCGPVHAIEVGARDINGGVRDLISTLTYRGVDLVTGAGVTDICDVRDYQGPPADLVLCLEVAEHDPDPSTLFAACGRLVRPGGLFVMTCATDPRPAHSAGDGGPLAPGEHYGNVPADVAVAAFPPDRWRWRALEVDTTAGDLRVAVERRDDGD